MSTYLSLETINLIAKEFCEATDAESQQCRGIALEKLISEVEELTEVVRQLIHQGSLTAKTWMEPGEFAALLGVSTSTLRTWRRDGRFAPSAYRQGARGYQFHAELAMRDAQEAVR
jgi:DNA-binding transcriptional regulator YiaG